MTDEERDVLEEVARQHRATLTTIEGLVARAKGDTSARVISPAQQKQAQIAYEHLDAIRKFGSDRTIDGTTQRVITLDDSLAIRRRHYGGSVQASAHLFGRDYDDDRAGRILYRPGVPYQQRRKGSDPVALTSQGEALAGWYEAEVIRRAS